MSRRPRPSQRWTLSMGRRWNPSHGNGDGGSPFLTCPESRDTTAHVEVSCWACRALVVTMVALEREYARSKLPSSPTHSPRVLHADNALRPGALLRAPAARSPGPWTPTGERGNAMLSGGEHVPASAAAWAPTLAALEAARSTAANEGENARRAQAGARAMGKPDRRSQSCFHLAPGHPPSAHPMRPSSRRPHTHSRK